MIKAIVTDIEGTTTSIRFVTEVLFPYAYEHLADYIQQHAQDPLVLQCLQDTRKELGNSQATQEEAIAALRQWIKEDRKITPLKTLQGLIWEQGYKKNQLKSHLYPEVYENLKHWQQQGIALYVYSSGSVKAQQLLFSHTEYGDLTPCFKGYFDTHIGHKREATAYEKIVQQIAVPAQTILFLSDIKPELDAAYSVGMHTVALNRDHSSQDYSPHPVVENFNQIQLPII